MPFRLAPLALLIFACVPDARAQATVSGRVVDADGPLPGANVLVLAASDSSLVRGAVANAEGAFVVERVPPGVYRLRVTFLGFEPYVSVPFDFAERDSRAVGEIRLQARPAALGEVSVSGSRPLFEQLPDRVVVNVGESPTLAGGSALDVVARAPGVAVEPGGTISIVGKRGVRVLVDGRERYVPADGVADFLAGLGAGTIASVEVITAPPAGLDADGDAGFINVVLKRQPGAGLVGSVTASGGYGRGELATLSASATYRRGRVTATAAYAGRRDGRAQQSANVRQLVGGSTANTQSERDPTQQDHSVQLGLDARLSDRTTVAAFAAAYQNRFSMDAQTRLVVSEGGAPVATTRVDVDEINRWRHGSAGLSVSHTLGERHRLSTSVDVLHYVNANPADYVNTTEDADGTRSVLTGTRKDTPLTISVVQADYTRPLGATVLAVGVKGAVSTFANDVDILGVDGLGPSESDLREDVWAGYAQADTPIGDAATLRAGLRYEHTDTQLDVVGQGRVVDRASGDWFPSVLLSRRTDTGSASVSLARRITRPTFTDLAPFTYFQDPFTLFTGNEGLRAAVATSARLTLERAGRTLTLQAAVEDSSIARFQNVIRVGQNAQTITSLNIGRTRSASATASVPVALAPGWRTENTASVVWQEAEDGTATLRETSYRVQSTQAVDLPGGLTGEATAFYQGPALAGTVRFRPFWGLRAALQRTFGAGRLTLAVDDPFDSVRRVGETVTDAGRVERFFDLSQPTVQLSYTLRFGGTRAPTSTPGASEERSRVE